MSLRSFVLFAFLLFASPAGAQGDIVFREVSGAGHTATVSWQLPTGFEESELLLVVDAGPRVRLTDELRGDRPRVVVRLPALAGTAHFVVRAGRRTDDGRYEEVDLATSERFPLVTNPIPGPIPIRAPATRPASGAVMEWWSEAAGRVPEGPSAGVESGPTSATAPDGSTLPVAIPPDRSDAVSVSRRTATVSAEVGSRAPRPPTGGFRDRTFLGAPVPLRN